MTYNFSIPICNMGEKMCSVREKARTKWVHIQQRVENILLEMDTCRLNVHDHNPNVLGSWIGFT